MSMSFNAGVDFSFGARSSEVIPVVPVPAMRYRLVSADGRVIAANVSEAMLHRVALAAGLSGYSVIPIIGGK